MGNKTLKVTLTKKIKFPRFPSFRFWPIPETTKLGNLGKFSFTSIFGSIRNPKSKIQKYDFKQKDATLR